jgi:hypothetical protein
MYLLALNIAIIAYVYSVILTEQGMILNFLYRWLDGLNETNKLPDWAFYPLIGCSKCVSGQMAFWYYIFTCHSYNLINHILLISITILFVVLIDKILTWSSNK